MPGRQSAIASESSQDAATSSAFLPLVFDLPVPLWWIGRVTGEQQVVEALPVSALQALCPVVAAAMLTYLERSGAAAATFVSGPRTLARRKSA